MAVYLKNYRIIHLSDLHFGPKHAHTNQNAISVEGPRQEVFNYPMSDNIIDFLQNAISFNKETIVLITGDLANFDQKNDFKEANKFLNKLMKKTRIPKEKIILVPGNHDITWSSYSKNDPDSMFPKLSLRRIRLNFYAGLFRQSPENRVITYRTYFGKNYDENLENHI